MGFICCIILIVPGNCMIVQTGMDGETLDLTVHHGCKTVKGRKKKKLCGCPPPPAPSFLKTVQNFLRYKSIPPLIFRI